MLNDCLKEDMHAVGEVAEEVEDRKAWRRKIAATSGINKRKKKGVLK